MAEGAAGLQQVDGTPMRGLDGQGLLRMGGREDQKRPDPQSSNPMKPHDAVRSNRST